MKFIVRQKVLDLLNSVGVSTVRYLSEKLSMPKPSILYNLNKLEQDGLVYKGGNFQHGSRTPCKIWHCGVKRQNRKPSKATQAKIMKQFAELEGSSSKPKPKPFVPRFKSVFVGGKNIWNEVIRR